MQHAPSCPTRAATDTSAAQHDRYDNALIRAVLRTTRTIALVSASANPTRPSYGVLKDLFERGYAVTPVNTGLAGQQRFGHQIIARLGDLPGSVDMIDIFRNSAAAGDVVDEALALPVLPKVIWMQLGVRNEAAALRAESRRITLIMNRCPKIKFGCLSI